MSSRTVACLLFAACSCGCVTEHFRAETVLFPDGGVDRAIWQHLNEEQQKQWREVRSGLQDERLETELWELADNLVKRQDGKPSNPKEYYTSARGRFASVEQIPEHYRKEAPPGLPASTLKPKAEREDFVLVTEHRWEETLTDCLKLEDIPAARRSLVDFVVPIIVGALRQELEPDYDISAVEPWLRDEAATWFDELTALYVELGLKNSVPELWDPTNKSSARKRLAAINERHGLASWDNAATFEQFGKDKLKQLVKRRNGETLDDESVLKLLQRLFAPMEPDQSSSRFELRAKEIIQAKYGSEDVFKTQLGIRLVPIFGLHQQPLQTPQKFDYRLTMPGFVIETTGELTSENRVRWRFDASQAFPFGYAMRCRSLQPNEENQRAMFNDVILKTANDCERLVRLLKAKPEWRETLATCVTEKSRQPLFDLRKKVRNRNDFKERLQFEDLESLLRLAP